MRADMGRPVWSPHVEHIAAQGEASPCPKTSNRRKYIFNLWNVLLDVLWKRVENEEMRHKI